MPSSTQKNEINTSNVNVCLCLFALEDTLFDQDCLTNISTTSSALPFALTRPTSFIIYINLKDMHPSSLPQNHLPYI